jgi:hypothetical protein
MSFSGTPEPATESDRDTSSRNEDERLPLAIGILATLVCAKLALHLLTNAFSPYEFHRDEFLYFAMGEHLRLWHMDFPPFIAMLSEITQAFLDDSLFGIRLPIALFSTLLLVFAALSAQELGGGRFAQALAGFGVLASVMFLRAGNLFQPVALDQLWWTAGLFCLLKLCRTDNPRWWLLYGALCGLGLLTKFSMLLFGFATFAALLVTPARRWLVTPWPWLGALIAFIIGSPSIVGQISLGFPVLDQMSDLRGAQLARVSALSFVLEQPMLHGGFVVAVIGAAALVFKREWRPHRLVGWTCVAAFVTLILLHGKSYYIAPIYPILFGAGAVALERFRIPNVGTAVRWGIVGVMGLYFVVLLPIALPILPPATMERYLSTIGAQSAATSNVGEQERIPQDFADMLNWREQVEHVAAVYNSLPDTDRERAVIFASNYGEAGAIDFYGPRYGIPKAIAVVGTYWFFGPGDLPGDIVILHGVGRDEAADYCGTIEVVSTVTHPFAVEEERDVVISICREPRQTLQELWPSMAGNN